MAFVSRLTAGAVFDWVRGKGIDAGAMLPTGAAAESEYA